MYFSMFINVLGRQFIATAVCLCKEELPWNSPKPFPPQFHLITHSQLIASVLNAALLTTCKSSMPWVTRESGSARWRATVGTVPDRRGMRQLLYSRHSTTPGNRVFVANQQPVAAASCYQLTLETLSPSNYTSWVTLTKHEAKWNKANAITLHS
jgi:hypothetical protein